MKHDLEVAINNVQSLRYEVENNLFIPKRFRKNPFTKEVRDGYVKYLKEEEKRLSDRLRGKPESISQV